MSAQSDAESNTIQCPVCGHENRPGSLVCANCGSMINTSAATRQSTRSLKDIKNDLAPEDIEAIESAPTTHKTGYRPGMGVELTVDGSKKPIFIPPDMLQSQVIMGRRDPITEQSPPVDLDEYAGYRMGVSRKHAFLQVTNDSLVIGDLGSSNGTYLNGRRLPMRQPQIVMEGDSLRLGQIQIKVAFVDVE